jgi:hypothetical protein
MRNQKLVGLLKTAKKSMTFRKYVQFGAEVPSNPCSEGKQDNIHSPYNAYFHVLMALSN